LFTVVGAAVVAASLVTLASASHSAKSVSPDAEAAWPWEPKGSVPAGTTDNNWEHSKGDLADSQFSYLKQLTPSNVANLKVAWTENLAAPDYSGGIQGAPIVVSGANKNIPDAAGTMYVAANKGVVALDAATGKVLWAYVGPNPKPKEGAAPAPQLQFGNTSKAFEYCDGQITTGQQDGSIASLNAKTGAPLWTNQVSAVSEFVGHTGQTSPVTDCAVGIGPAGQDMVFGGPNGSSSPLRGHLDGIDLKTGQLIWRWFTTPDPTQLPFILTWGNPAEAALGGGGTWGSSAIDPTLHMVYSESGNAYAQLGRQPGKDLWTGSSFALDTRTGQLVWYWQEAHHDNWDLDHGGAPILFNETINGKMYPVFQTCNKVGNCEILNRENGGPIPGFAYKETPVYDYSGKGLALNNEYPTQPWFVCNQAQMGVNGIAAAQAASVHFGQTMPKGTTCGLSYLYNHDPNDADAALAVATYPVGANGTPVVPRPTFTSTYSDSYTLFATTGSGLNYERNDYDPLTNSFIACANSVLAAQENASPTDWHKNSTGALQVGVYLTSVNMQNDTINWQNFLWGSSYKNGVLQPGVNPGYTDGTWSMGCLGGQFATAGNLLFVDSRGDNSQGSTTSLTLAANRNWGGTLAAYNASTGQGPLWTWQSPGGQMNGSPMTYQVGGKQYVAVYTTLPPIGTAAYNGHGDELVAFSL
jgi:glucose dehydrogenase